MTLSFGFNFQVKKSGEKIVVNNDSVFLKETIRSRTQINEHCPYF